MEPQREVIVLRRWAEAEGEALNLMLNLCSNPQLKSWAEGSEKEKEEDSKYKRMKWIFSVGWPGSEIG